MSWLRGIGSRAYWWWVWNVAVPGRELARTARAWLRFQFRRGAIDERYLWEAFAYLAQLDLDAPASSQYGTIFGTNAFVDIHAFGPRFVPETGARFTFQQIGKRLVVHEEVRANEWLEVYRTGRHCDVERMCVAVALLRHYYGDGPDVAKVERGAGDQVFTGLGGKA